MMASFGLGHSYHNKPKFGFKGTVGVVFHRYKMAGPASFNRQGGKPDLFGTEHGVCCVVALEPFRSQIPFCICKAQSEKYLHHFAEDCHVGNDVFCRDSNKTNHEIPGFLPPSSTNEPCKVDKKFLDETSPSFLSFTPKVVLL